MITAILHGGPADGDRINLRIRGKDIDAPPPWLQAAHNIPGQWVDAANYQLVETWDSQGWLFARYDYRPES